MATVIRPPSPIPTSNDMPSVFLAGSIEMDRASNWQQWVAAQFDDEEVVVLNPRRDKWDSTWEQEISNTQFREQVEWELAAQERADVVAMYFEPSTKSPITLLELGLFARSGKLVVCCPQGFWRKGNVDVVCRRYRVPMADSMSGLVNVVRQRIGSHH